MENKKRFPIVTVLLVLIIIGLVAYIICDKVLNKNDETTIVTQNEIGEGKTDVNEEVQEEELKGLQGRFYLLEGYNLRRRYYLALDNADLADENGNSIDFRDKKVYLVDMDLSDKNEFIKEIDLAKLIEGVYNEKINSLPNVLAEGTVNATNKSDINYYTISYYSADFPVNGEKEIPFAIGYGAVHDYEGMSNAATLSLGKENYILNVETMTVRKAD